MTTYPFVQSAVDLAVAKGPRLALLIHMAEGGGTVGYLSRPNPNGVSVHYVIEATGRIVQMLSESRMHTSLRSSDIRTTDDKPYDWRGTPITYGRTAARAVMGDWANTAKTLGPNHASIGVEFEGFARNGPNDKQKDAMARLWTDVKARYPGIRSLGHRDFTTRKACPGKLIPWEEVGGHATEDPMPAFKVVASMPVGRLSLADQEGIHYFRLRDSKLIKVTDRAAFGAKEPILPVRMDEPIVAGKPATDDWRLGYIVGEDPAFVLKRNVTVTPTVQSRGYVVTVGGKTAGTVTLP